MATIEKAGEIAGDFLKKVLSVNDVKVVKVARVDRGWETEVEVYEESSFIKSLGLPTRVQERNVYTVRLDDDSGVSCFERKIGD